MKRNWIEKYRDAASLANASRDALIGFNANIDVIHQLEEVDIELDEEPEEKQKVSSLKDLKAVLKHCVENGENREVELEELEHSFESGEERLGGQAGIMSNFLSSMGCGVIFYTPFLSGELAEKMKEKVLYPSVDGGFVLKNVRDAVNSDRTKRNLIFEYDRETTGRVIFSSTVKGFGPYFRKGVEDNFDQIQENVDRIIFSGFHDVEGNKKAKLEKSRKQLQMLDKPVHLEYVHRNEELARMISELVMPEVDSIGLDEDELLSLVETLNIDVEISDPLSLGEAFHALKKLIERFGMKRCHLHTLRFHLTVASKDYEVSQQRIRDAMLFGELSAINTCDTGEFPSRKDVELDMEDKHIHDLEDLHHFENFFDLDGFTRTGVAELQGYKVAAIPTIIHEDPSRLVGMGDIISSGAFIAEVK